MAARKNALEDISATSLARHAQNFASTAEMNVALKFTKDLVGHYIKYPNI